MNEHINNITIKIYNNEVTIIIDAKERSDTITSKLQTNNTFRFSYVHPANSIKESYTGYLEGKKIFIYPLYGKTFLINKPITPVII